MGREAKMGWLAVAALTAGLMTATCGGTDPAPSNSGGSGGTGNPATTITITASGASPRTLTVSRGTQVTVVNNDSRAHEFASDPHPTHETCPELNSVGMLSPGQSRQTSNLNTARSCGFHDHILPGTAALQGTITIQ